MRILLATTNKNKIEEFKPLFDFVGIDLVTLDDLPNVVEDGNTFFENAFKKAKEVSDKTGMNTIADDSGLVVPALAGEPGIYSARYAGENATDEENCAKLMERMKPFHSNFNNMAYYCCNMVFYRRGGKWDSVERKCYGTILHYRKGCDGFGFDPYFYISRLGKTMAELSFEEKDSVSHRGQAIRSIIRIL